MSVYGLAFTRTGARFSSVRLSREWLTFEPRTSHPRAYCSMVRIFLVEHRGDVPDGPASLRASRPRRASSAASDCIARGFGSHRGARRASSCRAYVRCTHVCCPLVLVWLAWVYARVVCVRDVRIKKSSAESFFFDPGPSGVVPLQRGQGSDAARREGRAVAIPEARTGRTLQAMWRPGYDSPANRAISTYSAAALDQANRAASVTRDSSMPTTRCWTG